MKTNGNDKTLESFKIFPVLAWATTILFSVFVYNITQDLKLITQSLESQTQQLQLQISDPSREIEQQPSFNKK